MLFNPGVPGTGLSAIKSTPFCSASERAPNTVAQAEEAITLMRVAVSLNSRYRAELANLLLSRANISGASHKDERSKGYIKEGSELLRSSISEGTEGGAESRDGAPFDVFNLGESDTVELQKVITEIESALGKKANIRSLPPVPGDMPLTYADISKARKLLQYNPTTRIQEGIPKFVEWYLGSV